MPVADNNTSDRTTDATTKEIIRQLKESEIDVRIIGQQRQENFLHNNNLTLLIVDQSSYLTVELSDDKVGNSEEEEKDSIELATYSNSVATVFAYMSIFENLWMQTQI